MNEPDELDLTLTITSEGWRIATERADGSLRLITSGDGSGAAGTRLSKTPAWARLIAALKHAHWYAERKNIRVGKLAIVVANHDVVHGLKFGPKSVEARACGEVKSLLRLLRCEWTVRRTPPACVSPTV